jgi:hypothetical protein
LATRNKHAFQPDTPVDGSAEASPKGTKWSEVAAAMTSADMAQKVTKKEERATEKAKAKQLTEPRLGTEWLDKFSIDKERPNREAEEKKKQEKKREKERVAEEKQEKKREKERVALTNQLTVIPGESPQQREKRIARWKAVEGACWQKELQHRAERKRATRELNLTAQKERKRATRELNRELNEILINEGYVWAGL